MKPAASYVASTVGTWGTGLFDGDLASDLRDDFKDFVGEGLSAEEATAKTLELYAEDLADPDDGPAGIIALAVAQWKLGRLQPEIRARALEAIDNGGDLSRWEEPRDRRRREKVLAGAREQLLSPMPTAKRVARPKRSTSPFAGGEVVLYQHPSGRTIVLWIVQTWGDRGGDYSIAEIVNVPAELVRLRPDAVVTAPSITGLDYETYEGSSRSPWVELLGLERMPPDRREVLGTVPYPTDRQTGPAVGTFVSPGPREQYLRDGSLDEHITRMLESRLL